MSVVSVTAAAVVQIENLIHQRGKSTEGIRIGIKTRGCTGLSYFIEYVDISNPLDEVVDLGIHKLFIDSKALLYILGTEIDFESNDLGSGFTFKNPKEKGRCGCGESFRV
jgi:iron-sulfur cluster assembly protein